MFLKSLLILTLIGGNGDGEDQNQKRDQESAPPAAVELAEPDVVAVLDAAPMSSRLTLAAPAPWAMFPLEVMRVAAGPDANQLVGKVQKFYESTQQLTAKFRQTYKNETFGTTKVSDGRLYIKKPGKMRWDYYAKKSKGKKAEIEKTFVSDGTMLWMVEHDQKQYAKQDLKDNMLPVAVTFLSGKGDLRRDFTAEIDRSGSYGKKDDYVLKLTPKKPSAQYKFLYLVVDPGNFRVKQSVVVEASDNTNHFQFYEPNTTKNVKDAWFLFNEKKFKGKYRLVNINEQDAK